MFMSHLPSGQNHKNRQTEIVAKMQILARSESKKGNFGIHCFFFVLFFNAAKNEGTCGMHVSLVYNNSFRIAVLIEYTFAY